MSAPTLSKWSLLDPALLASQINTAQGNTHLDRFAIQSAERFEAIVNAEKSGVYRHSGPLDRGLYDPNWTVPGLTTALT